MKARANATIYWPGMINNICSTKYNCKHGNEIAPSQTREPLMATPSPDWPFQLICADYFELNNHSYLAIVDRFSGWLNIYHFKPGCSTNNTLISTCRSLFIAYGAPEEISTVGGPQFMSNEFQNFLHQWGVRHRRSSANYPQSNGRAELGVKAAKQLIIDNTKSDGSLDNNKAAQAIIQYRNTPLPYINLSPAQILFHR